MGYSLQDFQDAAERKYAGLVIDDGPRGPITLRSTLRLSDSETDALDRVNKRMDLYQSGKDESGAEIEVRSSTLRGMMLDSLAIIADDGDALRDYLRSADLTVVMSVFTAYKDETKGAEGN